MSLDKVREFSDVVKQQLVFVEGGEFLMGDFGSRFGKEGLPYDRNKDSKPLHRVSLTSFSISRYKVTNQEFQFYLESNGLELREGVPGNQEDWQKISVPSNLPAHMDWYEAEKYCAWLAEVTSLPFSLPTEAQWEYAARSRGQYMAVATDDGTYRITKDPITEGWRDGPKGINISTRWDRKAFAKEMGWKTDSLTPLPVDGFPPNPLGVYAMSDNGLEWIKDWYDPDYYKTSPILDPQGPDEAVHKDHLGQYTKVLRGQEYANPIWGGGVNVHRLFGSPNGIDSDFGDPYLSSKTARCVVNSPERINKTAQ
ncbi:formylglycine-generating enzyme family protein [Pseudomonas sp. X10]